MKKSTVKTNRQISFYVDKTCNELYQRKYPYTLGVFLRHCMYAAINSKEVFERIFFDVKESVIDSNTQKLIQTINDEEVLL